jgi:hypothetical protein
MDEHTISKLVNAMKDDETDKDTCMTAVQMLAFVVSNLGTMLKVQQYCDQLFDIRVIDVYTNILNYEELNEGKPEVLKIILNGLCKIDTLPQSILEAFNASGLLLSVSNLLKEKVETILSKSSGNSYPEDTDSKQEIDDITSWFILIANFFLLKGVNPEYILSASVFNSLLEVINLQTTDMLKEIGEEYLWTVSVVVNKLMEIKGDFDKLEVGDNTEAGWETLFFFTIYKLNNLFELWLNNIEVMNSCTNEDEINIKNIMFISDISHWLQIILKLISRFEYFWANFQNYTQIYDNLVK